MSNRIKGITIEIGGDTTPLQKALSDVNDKSSKLKSELKDVERLLKLDPTNTTLLAQKQELLGQSIQATKEKLDKLREAEASVQEQAAKGTITQEQYRAFQREVESTAEELGYLEKKQAEATTEIDKGGEATKKAAKEADNAKDKWKKFGEALKTVGEIATKAIVALGSAATAAGAAIVGMSVNAAYNADDLNTLSSGWGWLTSQVSSIAHNLLQAAKDALGIHSPSAVFRDEVGKMMAAGIGEGFNAETPKQFQRIKGRLSAEEKKLSAYVTNNSTTNKSVSLGGIVVNINGGVQSAADARRYGNEIAETIQRELRYKGVLQLA